MVVTVTSTAPVPAGTVAMIWSSDTTVKWPPDVPPNATAVAPARPVPVIVTTFPPASGPPAGLSPVTAGAGT